MLIDGIMLLWFVEAVLAVLFVAIDIRRTPEALVMKWGFVIVTLYSGPIGALLYVLSCREPLPGTHEQYVAARWRQVVGSTMHCVAGDGLGIIAGAVVSAMLGLPKAADFAVEYAVGFLFGVVRLPGVVHEATDGRLIPPISDRDILARVPVDERRHGGHDGRAPGLDRRRTRGAAADLRPVLVLDVDRADGRIRGRVPDQLVAGEPRTQARNDDRPANRPAGPAGRRTGDRRRRLEAASRVDDRGDGAAFPDDAGSHGAQSSWRRRGPDHRPNGDGQPGPACRRHLGGGRG